MWNGEEPFLGDDFPAGTAPAVTPLLDSEQGVIELLNVAREAGNLPYQDAVSNSGLVSIVSEEISRGDDRFAHDGDIAFCALLLLEDNSSEELELGTAVPSKFLLPTVPAGSVAGPTGGTSPPVGISILSSHTGKINSRRENVNFPIPTPRSILLFHETHLMERERIPRVGIEN